MGEQTTGTKDKHYNLVSVAYHALHGAWNYDEYIQDAEREGDQELADFFRDVKERYATIGNEAKKLLTNRLS